MVPNPHMPRIAVVSLFLDKRHGSERVIAEWLTHLPDTFEAHIYTQRVEDVDASRFVVHRIPLLPGPHLFNFLWWLAASRMRLVWDSRFRNLKYDLIFSSGADWPGADVICVHIVFAEYFRRIKSSLSLFRNPFIRWPLVLHRRAYYFAVRLLERRAYANSKSRLIVHSRKTAADIERAYGSQPQLSMIRPGIDHTIFNPSKRSEKRADARAKLGVTGDEFLVLVIGNDWRNKGFPALIEALGRLRELPVRLMIVSREDLPVCKGLVQAKGLTGRVRFMPPRDDVESYYAAADVYAAPSLQDSYSMPPAEAMACGMPVIVSAEAGVSEIITNELDGLILDDPTDTEKLAAIIRRLYQDREFASALGARANQTAQQYTWAHNGQELADVFEEILRLKSEFATLAVKQAQ